ncbi:10673_t:CDS:1, partial [Cetraspora pellucida]
DKSLTNEEQDDYQQALESYMYSCGTSIFPDDHYLKEVVFVRTRISCDSLIEILYYSSYKSGNYPICYYCEERKELVTPPQSLREHFKQIYPLCEVCRKNKKFYMKGEIKTNKRSTKRHIMDKNISLYFINKTRYAYANSFASSNDSMTVAS